MAELLELIDEHKTDIPDYAYMKMMECMMKINKAKDLDSEDKEELNCLARRNQMLTQSLYEQLFNKKKCSVCRSPNHTKDNCGVIETIHIRNCEQLGDEFGGGHLSMYATTDSNPGVIWLVDAFTGVYVGRMDSIDKEYTENEMFGNIVIPHPADSTKKLQIWMRQVKKHQMTHVTTRVGMSVNF